MAKFAKKDKEEWIQKAKQMEKDCTEKVKQIAESYIRDPALIADALSFGSRFYSYSVRNNQLIFAQNPHSMYVQSYPAWKKMGYSVKRGESGMKIFVPVKLTLLNINGDFVKLSDATKKQQEDYHKGLVEGSVITKFKLGTVFDIAQTTFPPEKYPELFCVGYPSEKHEDICKGLTDYCKEFVHCEVKIEDLHSLTLRGFYSRNMNEITLNSTLQGTQKLSTFAHELGHAIIHNSWTSTSTHRKEFEADALDIMIESGFGIEVTDARKDHLVNHYRAFSEELKNELGEEFSDSALSENINDVLASVFGTYNDIVEDINLCVEKYIPHEILIEHEKERLAMEQENYKGYEKEMESDKTLAAVPSYDLDEFELDR